MIHFRPLPILTVTAAAALIVLLGLGTWQLERRTEKHRLLAKMAERADMPPAPVEYLLATGNYAAFRPATARGVFFHDQETFVHFPRHDTGPTRLGYKVITPFELNSGGIILVDRGWIPLATKNPATREQGQAPDEITVEGSLRPSSEPGNFTPPPDLENRVFYQRNTRAIAQHLGLTLVTPLLLESASAVAGGPEPILKPAKLADNHLQYALTWFSLAIVLIAVYLRYHAVRGRLYWRNTPSSS